MSICSDFAMWCLIAALWVLMGWAWVLVIQRRKLAIDKLEKLEKMQKKIAPKDFEEARAMLGARSRLASATIATHRIIEIEGRGIKHCERCAMPVDEAFRIPCRYSSERDWDNYVRSYLNV